MRPLENKMEYTFGMLTESMLAAAFNDTIESTNKYKDAIENALRVLRLPLSEELGIKLALEQLDKV